MDPTTTTDDRANDPNWPYPFDHDSVLLHVRDHLRKAQNTLVEARAAGLTSDELTQCETAVVSALSWLKLHGHDGAWKAD